MTEDFFLENCDDQLQEVQAFLDEIKLHLDSGNEAVQWRKIKRNSIVPTLKRDFPLDDFDNQLQETHAFLDEIKKCFGNDNQIIQQIKIKQNLITQIRSRIAAYSSKSQEDLETLLRKKRLNRKQND